MTRKKAEKVVQKIRKVEFDQAVDIFLEFANKTEDTKPPDPDPSPLTPSGAIPVYKKPNQKGRLKKPGRKKGHPGKSRKVPDRIDEYKKHLLEVCPHCRTPVEKPITTRKRYIEDIPETEPEVTEHIINGYWCPQCRKIVEPAVVEAMPNDNIGLRTFVLTAWLHYSRGISINYLVDMLNKLLRFKISPGRLTQGWMRLANLLKPEYKKIGEEAKNSPDHSGRR